MTAEETVIVRNEFFYNLQLNQFVSLFWLYQLHLAESCLIDESVIQLHHGLIGRRTMGLGWILACHLWWSLTIFLCPSWIKKQLWIFLFEDFIHQLFPVFCVSIIAIDFLFFACTLCISMLEQILLQRSVKQCLDIEAEKSLRDSVSYLPIVSKHLGRPSTTIYYIYTQIYRVTLYILLQSYKKGGRAAVFFLFSILFTFLEGRDIKKEKHWGVKIKAGANNVISRTNGFQHFILKIFL